MNKYTIHLEEQGLLMTYGFYGWKTADVKDANGRTPRDYYDMLSHIWCAQTCAPRMRAEWTPENKRTVQGND